MSLKSNGQSADYIKRHAKKIKKETGISHHDALDQASQEAGFSNWKHFISSAKQNPESPVMTYTRPLSGVKVQKPNAKMPIPAHQEAGRLLREARTGALYCWKSLDPYINPVRDFLDDWVQLEYTSREELPDEVFRNIYYGKGPELSFGTRISLDEKNQLDERARRVKEILSENYPDCPPVREMHQQLDSFMEAVAFWCKTSEDILKAQASGGLARGMLVHIEPWGWDALVYDYDEVNQTVRCYTESGPALVARHEISVHSDQSKADAFSPMRLYLPYGKWTCADGTEVLFSRDYCPLWTRSPDGHVSAIAPDRWVSFEKQIWYFDDTNLPWRNKKSFDKSFGILIEWGVHTPCPQLIYLLPEAVMTGNVDMLTKKDTNSRFPKEQAA